MTIYPHLLQLNAQNINSLALEADTVALEPKTKAPENFSAREIYAFAQMPLVILEKKIAQEKEKDLKKKFSKYYYGVSALHSALLNPDINVFKKVLATVKELEISVPSISQVKRSRVTTFHDRYIFFEGDTLFNIALTLLNKEKMQFLAQEGLTQLNLPKLQNQSNTYSIRVPATELYQSEILDYCTFLMIENKNIRLSQKEKDKFYFNFALSFENSLNIDTTTKIQVNRDRVVRQYIKLLLIDESYQYPLLIKPLVSQILNHFAQARANHFEYRCQMDYSKLKNHESFLPTVLSKLQTHNYLKDRDFVLNIESILGKFKKNSMQFGGFIEEKNVYDGLKKLLSYREKLALQTDLAICEEVKATFKL